MNWKVIRILWILILPAGGCGSVIHSGGSSGLGDKRPETGDCRLATGNWRPEDSGLKSSFYMLNPENYSHYAAYFQRMSEESITTLIPDSQAWEWMKGNIPFFACPQDNFEEIYYFRWWSFRKHIIQTPSGYAITEFLVPRSYADQYNLISCALGHHTYESRWLRNRQYLQDNLLTWFRGNNGQMMAKLRKFSSWTADALYNSYLVNGDREFLTGMFPDLDKEYRLWEEDHRRSDGLFWQTDVADGMEESISGGRRVKNARPTINNYMFGNARALEKMAGLMGEKDLERYYQRKADTLKSLVENRLWNQKQEFFETVKEDGQLAGVREAVGFIPWYFRLPGKGFETAWKQVADEKGFLAPFGLTTAELRHPEYRTHGCCNCEWDGAVWPFATSQTLTAMANLLNYYDRKLVNDSLWFRLMEDYVESQYYRGKPYIGEYLDGLTGYWLKGDQERSRFYNHSTFADLIIAGIAGLRPQEGNRLEINPLLPDRQWDWFCLDGVLYHDRILTICWDRDGSRFHNGKGLYVLADGKEIGRIPELGKIVCMLK